MSNTTARLGLPVIAPSQAQKHVTHNEALQMLDRLSQLVLTGVGTEAPPAAPSPGEIHAVGPAPTGDWAGQSGMLAQWVESAWHFMTPQEGWSGWDVERQKSVVYGANGWLPETPDLENLAGIGIGTTSDASNRFSLASDSSLFSHAGTGHRMKINKASENDTASLLYQSGWIGHAELGLTGGTDFHLKVSEDGNQWTDALVVDAANGHVHGAAVTQSATDATAGRLMKVGYCGLAEGLPAPSYDANDANFPAFNYRFTTSGVNVPFPSYNTSVQTFRSWDTRLMQLALDVSGRVATRGSSDSGVSWNDWVEVVSTGNLVGTVSQSAGVPTGAVIERGSNANGDYVRFADGTQMCWITGLTLTHPGSNNRLEGDWTLPATFSGAPATNAMIDNGTTGDAAPNDDEIGAPQENFNAVTNSVRFRVFRQSGRTGFTSGDTLDVQASAIGRWY